MPRRKANPDAPAVSGVYILFRNKEVLYIGRSADCHGRIKTHRQHGREFDYALVSPCPADDAVWVEASLVLAFQSPQNKQFRTPKPAPPERVVIHVPEDGLELLNKTQAVDMAAAYGLRQTFLDALKSGEVRMIDRAKPGAKMWRPFITKGELRVWLNARQTAALAAAE